jgi:hypothetical protein
MGLGSIARISLADARLKAARPMLGHEPFDVVASASRARLADDGERRPANVAEDHRAAAGHRPFFILQGASIRRPQDRAAVALARLRQRDEVDRRPLALPRP